MELAAIFKDGMVLQQNQKNRILGKSVDEEIIEIDFDGKKYCTKGKNGEWAITIEPVAVGGPYEMAIKSSFNGEMVLKDILVGEVWFAGGQSNMELELQNSDDGKNVCQNSDYDWIRFYNVPKYAKLDDGLLEEEEHTLWKKASGMQCADMSAVAFYFAKNIYEVLRVPVGIIDCYWGGTSATCWFSRNMISDVPEVMDYIEEWDEVIANKSDEQYEAEMKEYDDRYQAWNSRVEKLRADKPDITWEEINETAGICPWPQPMGGGSPFRPFGLYESMVKRVAPYGIKGFLYYQAEEDWSRASYYEKLNQAVIEQWREVFSYDEKKDIPFLITQLPMYIAKGEEDVHNFARLREQQSLTAEHNSNVGLAVLIDCGEFDNIHPTDKETPGKRLAFQALGKVYGKIEKYDSMKVEHVNFFEETAIVSFLNTYGEIRARFTDKVSLTAKREDSEVPAKVLSSDKIFGFEISGDGKVFYPANVLVVGEKIKISSEKVSRPVALRYGYTDFGVVNVYNAAGLPLAPFVWNKN